MLSLKNRKRHSANTCMAMDLDIHITEIGWSKAVFDIEVRPVPATHICSATSTSVWCASECVQLFRCLLLI